MSAGTGCRKASWIWPLNCLVCRRMSDAVEGAEVILYGVSKRYKESANCRLEANYAHQQE